MSDDRWPLPRLRRNWYMANNSIDPHFFDSEHEEEPIRFTGHQIWEPRPDGWDALRAAIDNAGDGYHSIRGKGHT